MKEIWKDVIGFETLYWVSSLGRVKSKRKVLKIEDNRQGYPVVCFSKENKTKTFLVHRLIALAFIENPESKKTVNHLSGIKNDNRLENLEWATQSENAHHAFRMGLMVSPFGESHHFSKLTEKKVLKIREEYAAGNYTQRKLAAKYRISQTQVSNIVNRKRWTHI